MLLAISGDAWPPRIWLDSKAGCKPRCSTAVSFLHASSLQQLARSAKDALLKEGRIDDEDAEISWSNDTAEQVQLQHTVLMHSVLLALFLFCLTSNIHILTNERRHCWDLSIHLMKRDSCQPAFFSGCSRVVQSAVRFDYSEVLKRALQIPDTKARGGNGWPPHLCKSFHCSGTSCSKSQWVRLPRRATSPPRVPCQNTLCIRSMW